jgi:DNA-binding response OmpR family regulator
MSSLFQKKNQKLEMEIEKNLPSIRADKGKVKQVVINLLSNANKFTSENGTITLKAKKSENDGFVEISVTDTGRGIRPEDMGILFDEFRQFGAPSERGEKGTGLGLALCKRFVEMHKGKIWAESEYAKGSKFTFTVPIAKEVIPKVIPEVIPKVIPTTKLNLSENKILVVEDDEKASKLIKYYLEEQGYSTYIISSGDEVVKLAKEIRPKIITLDMFLPGKDGWEVLKELKEEPATENIPVIIISMLDNKEVGYTLNADDYFVKPVDKNKFLQKIKELNSVKKIKQDGTVLVIDDDPMSVKLTSSILEDSGYKVLKAYGGKEGIEIAKEKNPQLIILDLMMPEMTGFDVLDELKKYNETKDIPVIVLTARDLTKEDMKVLDGRIKQLMTKGSFDKKDFLGEIKKYLS